MAATATIFLALVLFTPLILKTAGAFLVVDEPLRPADAAVVLSTGLEYYPRLSEAGRLYRDGLVERVVINGDRKNEALRELETAGFELCCPWYEDFLRILEIHGVPRDRVVVVSAPDAYDTVSEARAVGSSLAKIGITRIIVTTSKSHTRRALYIWKYLYGGRFSIQAAAAREDPFEPSGWWREGRQIRWVLAEYGAWPYGWLKLRQ
jgi:uncharacterized SAM-binding protein YcdF (DUF218 family)